MYVIVYVIASDRILVENRTGSDRISVEDTKTWKVGPDHVFPSSLLLALPPWKTTDWHARLTSTVVELHIPTYRSLTHEKQLTDLDTG